ncbi:hypothetical protein [Variovorax sp. LjRoot290]|uniref:hypothetical protein n=1 Tax=Variovorax sp. LjRoot290 TaxID=3342316 RepID=UPI003F515CB3
MRIIFFISVPFDANAKSVAIAKSMLAAVAGFLDEYQSRGLMQHLCGPSVRYHRDLLPDA